MPRKGKICNNKLCPGPNPQPYFHFYKDKSRKDGRSNTCIKCHKKYHLKYRNVPENKKKKQLADIIRYKEQKPKLRMSNRHQLYGISESEFLAQKLAQDNRCAICNIAEIELSKGLGIDHCHSTGKFRGLLCYGCNTGLGSFKDNIDLMYIGIEYIKENS